jgi:dTDP-4-dehydrorhamnose reductase
MRILVTGCGGMLGEAVYSEFKGKHTVYPTDIDLNEDWLNYLDVRSADSVDKMFKVVEPDVVLHLAALTDIEYCELNPSHAFDTNFVGTCNVVRTASKYYTPIVYISSAGIFDGKKPQYDEDDVPNPLNVYAKSKYAGELKVLTHPEHTIVRAGWMMGGGPLKDKKFIAKIMSQIRCGADTLYAVRDKLGTPTYTYDFAATLRHLIENKMQGMYHRACAGGCTRVDVVQEMLDIINPSREISLKAVNSSYFKKEYFAKRPFSEELVSNKLNSAPEWGALLADYLNRFEWKV